MTHTQTAAITPGILQLPRALSIFVSALSAPPGIDPPVSFGRNCARTQPGPSPGQENRIEHDHPRHDKLRASFPHGESVLRRHFQVFVPATPSMRRTSLAADSLLFVFWFAFRRSLLVVRNSGSKADNGRLKSRALFCDIRDILRDATLAPLMQVHGAWADVCHLLTANIQPHSGCQAQ